MGPRPDGRGKLSTVCERAPKSLRVNGAAARRPRKVCALQQADAQAPASMGPRPDGRGKTLSGPPCRLSRGVNGAAARRPRKAQIVESQPDGSIRRQWGRGQTAAESMSAADLSEVANRRQWGRGQTAAESSFSTCLKVRSSSVNGAAARRPRKGYNPLARMRAAPCVNGAAARRPRKGLAGRHPVLCIDASMGPRPDGRGKYYRRVKAAMLSTWRQWGRGQTAAERPDGERSTYVHDLRQWGRGQTAAESLGPPRTWQRRSRVNGAAARRPRKVEATLKGP